MRAIYYVDLHKGGLIEPASPVDVRLHGQAAFDMNCAILDYAYEQGIDDVIHGGDESTFVKDDPNKHLNHARAIQGTMQYHAGDLHRVIGNHEPIDHLKSLGFKTRSYKKAINTRTNLVVFQPDIGKQKDQTVYSYDPSFNKSKLPREVSFRKNIIVASHWAFDRMKRGYRKIYDLKGYAYHDNTEKIAKHLANNARVNVDRVLSLHGHEHRFSLTQDLGFNCLVMPSIVQADIDAPDKPCGLFVEITDEKTPDGSLNWDFKKITDLRSDTDEFDLLKQQYDIETVDLDYMRRYDRPVVTM